MSHVLAFIFAFFAAVPCLAGSKPMPSEAALKAAQKLVIDTFRDELSASDKKPAVKAMLETAEKTERDAEKAALYLSAADVASRAVETKLAFEALEKLAASFDVDLLALKLAAIESAAKEARSTESRISVANRGLELANDAEQADRFEIAESALKSAAAASSRVRDAELRRSIVVRRREMERARRQHEQEQALVEAARKTLKEKPDDPDAHETLGKHLAFDKNDWAAALKHLAKASEADLQKAALADQSGATVAAQATTLGDWWWALGEGADDERDKLGYRSRAAFWYSRALPELTGLSKARIERRLQDAGKEAMAGAAAQAGNDSGKFIDVTLAPGVIMRFNKIPGSAAGKIKEFYLGETEVTQKQWVAVMGNNPSAHKGERLPVDSVSWDDCKAFIDRLANANSRMIFRFPTDGEFDYACLAGKDFAYYTDAAAEFMWTKENSKTVVQEVARLKPNAWGLYDMLGNIWEWSMANSFINGGSVWQMRSQFGKMPIRWGNNDKINIAIGFRVAAEPR